MRGSAWALIDLSAFKMLRRVLVLFSFNAATNTGMAAGSGMFESAESVSLRNLFFSASAMMAGNASFARNEPSASIAACCTLLSVSESASIKAVVAFAFGPSWESDLTATCRLPAS